MRALVLLISLVALGNVDALAVNAPLTVDPSEDAFAPKPRNATPEATPGLGLGANPGFGATRPGLAPQLAAPTAERAPIGNPLWAIPLGRLTATRERPLFAPTRRPPPVAMVAQPAVASIAPPKPAEPEKPQLSLVGTVAAGSAQGIGLFLSSTERTVVRLKTGENHKGWILHAIRPRQAVLAKGLENAVLEFPPPDLKAGAVSAAPPPPPAPGGAAMPPSSFSSALSVNAARATGSPSTAAPTIIVQPPVLAAPPAPVNPFQQRR